MNNEAIQRLREPAAWVLLGSVGAKMLSVLIGTIGSMTGEFGGSGADGFFGLVGSMSGFLSLVSLGAIVIAVLLVITAKEKSPRIFAIVLIGMILVGIAAFFGVISLITGFFGGGGIGSGMSNFLSTAADLAVAALVGFVLLKLFNDPTVVPRNAAPAQQSFGYGPPSGVQQPFPPQTGGQQPFAPHTGAQQSFAPQHDPKQSGQDFPVGGGQSYGAQPWQPPQTTQSPQPAADPGQTGSGHQGWPQEQEPYRQPSGAQAAFQQPSYGQSHEAQPDPSYGGYQQSYEQQGYPGQQDHGQQSYAQQGYAQQDYAQQGYPGQQDYAQQSHQDAGAAAVPSGAQPSYDWSAPPQAAQPPYAGQPGYDTPSPQQPSAPYGTGGQPAYGAAPEPYGGPQQGYPSTGGQASYGSGGQPGYGTGGQASYGAGDQAPYGTGGQPGYGGQYGGAPQPSYDDEATVVQTPGVSAGEQAAQEAVQYGWYQQDAPAEQPHQGGDRHRDTPLDDFLRSDDAGDGESTTRMEPGYGNRFANDGSYGATPQETTSPYGENYGVDQQQQQNSDRGGAPQGWYRDDDRR